MKWPVGALVWRADIFAPALLPVGSLRDSTSIETAIIRSFRTQRAKRVVVIPVPGSSAVAVYRHRGTRGLVAGGADIDPALVRLVEVERFEQRGQLTVGELAPHTRLDAADAQRAEADAAQPLDRNADLVHHPADQVVYALVHHNLQDQSFGSLALDANLLRHDSLSLDGDAGAKALQRRLGRPR